MRKPIVVFTSDDGYLTDYTLMHKEFRRRGLSGTNFLVGANADTMKADRINWELVRTMVEKGWDYQCHSYNHVYFDTITPTVTQNEMTANNQAYTNKGLSAPKHTAYPGGRINDANRSVILQNRETSRFARYELTPKAYNTYEEAAAGVDIVGIACDIQTENRFTEIKSAVNETIANNGILVLYWHGVTPTGRTPATVYEITQEYMNELLDYIADTNAQVMNYSEMCDYAKNNV
jgi:peptidoglycan/xylan/chitin deacetylase (PgdA/CDA1 family)